MSAINANKSYNTLQVARSALKKMQEAPDINEANRIGDVFLTSIKENSTREDERALAIFASKASKAMYMKPGLEKIEKDTKVTAFKFLAEGINCPVGKALAKVASDTLETIFPAANYGEYDFPKHAKPISDSYLEGIELYGTKNEKLLARTVRKAASEVNTKFSHNIERMSLGMISEGVNEESPNNLMKRAGSDAMKCDAYYDDRKAPKVAETFLAAIEKTGTPEEKLIARLGIDASIQEGCSQNFNTLMVAMNAISSGIEAPVNNVVFDMIKNVGSYSASTLFEEFEKNTEDTNNAAIACAAGRMIGTESYIHRNWFVSLPTGFGQSLAIDMIEKGMTGTPEKNLMEFYKRADAGDTGDAGKKSNSNYYVGGIDYETLRKTKRFTKESILKAVAKYAENPENRAIAKKALRKAPFKTGIISSPTWKKNSKAINIYDDAANKIIYNIKEKEFAGELS